MIGIIQVIPQQMTPVGNLIRRSMILVHQVGVFQMEEKMESGQMHWVHLPHMPEHTIVQIGV